MKKLFIIPLLFMLSCQQKQDSDQKLNQIDADFKRQVDSIQEAERTFTNCSQMYQSLLELDAAKGTDNAHDMLIVKMGKKNADMFFEESAKVMEAKHLQDSMDNERVDSIIKSRNK